MPLSVLYLGTMRGKNFQFKITATAILCFAIGVAVILCTQFFYLQTAFTNSAKEELYEKGEHYSWLIKNQLSIPLSYLGGVVSGLEPWIETGGTTVDRRQLQSQLFHAYSQFDSSEGSAFMLEPDVFDLDAKHIGGMFGTKKSGRVSFYFYRDEYGSVKWHPYTEQDDMEFEQQYYTGARDAMQATYSDPYLYELEGEKRYLVRASWPIIGSKGQFFGVMTSDMYLDTIHSVLGNEEIYKTGYIVVVTESGSLLYAPDIDDVGKAADYFGFDFKPPADEEKVSYSEVKSHINGKPSITATVKTDLGVPGGVYYITLVVPKEEANAVHIRLLWILTCMSIAVGFIIAFAISGRIRIIVKPLKTMTELIRNFGETGSLSHTESERKQTEKIALANDDIGESLRLLISMFDRLIYYGNTLSFLAERNIAQEINTLSDDDTIGNALTKLEDSLNDILTQIGSTSSRVETLARQVADGSDRLYGGAEKQDSSVKNLMESVASVTEQSKENTRGAEEVLAFTEAAGEKMAMSMENMNNLGLSMQDITKAQGDIRGIIKVIDDIAFQTNILALNAAVEAARAGDSGKGFAVVADEVRSLATKSVEAARTTTELISNSLVFIEEGNRLTELTGNNISEMSDRTNQIIERIKLITAASIRQQAEIERINADIEIISRIIAENTSAANISTEQSKQLTDQASNLSSIISSFELKR